MRVEDISEYFLIRYCTDAVYRQCYIVVGLAVRIIGIEYPRLERYLVSRSVVAYIDGIRTHICGIAQIHTVTVHIERISIGKQLLMPRIEHGIVRLQTVHAVI